MFDVKGLENNTRLVVYDLLGQVVAEAKLTETITTFDTKAWTSGLYVWRMQTSDKMLGNGKVQIMKW